MRTSGFSVEPTELLDHGLQISRYARSVGQSARAVHGAPVNAAFGFAFIAHERSLNSAVARTAEVLERTEAQLSDFSSRIEACAERYRRTDDRIGNRFGAFGGGR